MFCVFFAASFCATFPPFSAPCLCRALLHAAAAALRRRRQLIEGRSPAGRPHVFPPPPTRFLPAAAPGALQALPRTHRRAHTALVVLHKRERKREPGARGSAARAAIFSRARFEVCAPRSMRTHAHTNSTPAPYTHQHQALLTHTKSIPFLFALANGRLHFPPFSLSRSLLTDDDD